MEFSEMKILYLYTEVMGYLIPVFEELVKKYGAQVDVIHWDKQKLTPYTPPAIDGVRFHGRTDLSNTQLAQLVQDIAPDLAYVSGWQDKGYLYIARQLKSQGCPTVVGFDDQWHGSFRQIAGSYLMKLFWKKRYFSHAWVAGPYQFEYASRMGFSKSQIIFNLLSCDIDAFSQSAVHQLAQQETPSFLFVGRLHPNKGLDCLIEAFRIYKANRGAWGLTIVGNGPMRKRLEKSESVEVKDFQSAEGLREIISRSNLEGIIQLFV
jgi:glycosyltransferase involved in cell wall biosynthesis